MNKISVWAILVALVLGFSSCGRDPKSTGIEYAPEMYHSIPLEPYTQIAGVYSPFRDSMNAQIPPDGTIPRGGHATYDLPNNDSGRVLSDKRTINPVPATEANLAAGDTLYRRYCGICHGKGLKGDGKIADHDAINPPDLNGSPQKDFSAGRLYFTIMYGKGVMGSYASQLTWEERWKVIHHVQKLQHPDMYANIGPDGVVKAAVPDTAKAGIK